MFGPWGGDGGEEGTEGPAGVGAQTKRQGAPMELAETVVVTAMVRAFRRCVVTASF